VLSFLRGRRRDGIWISTMSLRAPRAAGRRLRDVLRRALCLATIGIGAGTALAAFAAQGLRTLLLGVSPFDPLTHGRGLTVVDWHLPAGVVHPRAARATRVDPIVALRGE
jgi:hypothetical protein